MDTESIWNKIKSDINLFVHAKSIMKNVIKHVIKTKNRDIINRTIEYLEAWVVIDPRITMLYKYLYKNNDLSGIDKLVSYYEHNNAPTKRLKYLNILSWFKFNIYRRYFVMKLIRRRFGSII